MSPRKSSSSADIPAYLPNTVDNIKWPPNLRSPPEDITADVAKEALEFLLQPGNFRCDKALLTSIEKEGDSYEPLEQKGQSTHLKQELKEFIDCRIFSIAWAQEDYCPPEFRPYKAAVDTFKLWKSALTECVKNSGIGVDDNLSGTLNTFYYNHTRRKVHSHPNGAQRESRRDVQSAPPSRVSAEKTTPEKKRGLSIQTAKKPIPFNNLSSNLSMTPHEEKIISLICSISNHDSKNFDKELLFSFLPNFYKELGRLLNQFGISFAVLAANISDEEKPKEAHCGDFVIDLKMTEESKASERYRAIIHERFREDMKNALERYFVDLNFNHTGRVVDKDSIEWLAGDTESAEVEFLGTVEQLKLTPNADFTTLKEDTKTVIEELDRYLLETYRLREGCHDAASVPWDDVYKDMNEDGESFIEICRLPVVKLRQHEIPIVLQSPANMTHEHRISLALHILKGQVGLLQNNERFCWASSSDTREESVSETNRLSRKPGKSKESTLGKRKERPDVDNAESPSPKSPCLKSHHADNDAALNDDENQDVSATEVNLAL